MVIIFGWFSDAAVVRLNCGNICGDTLPTPLLHLYQGHGLVARTGFETPSARKLLGIVNIELINKIIIY
jgi:hypothetical protein